METTMAALTTIDCEDPQAWLAGRIGCNLGWPGQAVDALTTLARLGVHSAYAINGIEGHFQMAVNAEVPRRESVRKPSDYLLDLLR